MAAKLGALYGTKAMAKEEKLGAGPPPPSGCCGPSGKAIAEQWERDQKTAAMVKETYEQGTKQASTFEEMAKMANSNDKKLENLTQDVKRYFTELGGRMGREAEKTAKASQETAERLEKSMDDLVKTMTKKFDILLKANQSLGEQIAQKMEVQAAVMEMPPEDEPVSPATAELANLMGGWTDKDKEKEEEDKRKSKKEDGDAEKKEKRKSERKSMKGKNLTAKKLELERSDDDTSLFLTAEKVELQALVEQAMTRWRIGESWQKRLIPGDGPLQALIRSRLFTGTVNFAIFINVAFIAWQAEDAVAKAKEGDKPWMVFTLFDLGFCGFFFLEIVLRLLGDRIVFFLGPDFRWNLMDLSFVAMDGVNQIFLFIIEGVDLSYISSFRAAIKMIRLARAARALRMFRIVRNSLRARLLLEETVASASLGFWLLMVLGVVLIFFGLFFMQASADVLLDQNDIGYSESLENKLLKHFGSSQDSIFSLFELASGGQSWSATYLYLVEVDPVYGVVFILFVFFTLLLFLNVVTGVFVNSAVQRSRKHEVENKTDEAENIRSLLRKAELENADGLVSKEEFLKFLTSPYGKGQLMSLGLENAEALGIYELLDKENNKQVNIDELASGCARFTQPVRSADNVSILLAIKKITKEQRILASFVQESFAAIKVRR